MKLSLPILLTWLRIALLPILVAVFYLPVEWARPACAIIFALAGVTDWLDGLLARKLNQTTAFGAFLDPVADKLLVAVALVLLVQADPRPWVALPAMIIIGREILISALREWMAEIGRRRVVAVSSLGKFKTVAQIVSLVCLLYFKPLLGLPTYAIGLVLLYLAAGLTLFSMFVYLNAAWKTNSTA